MAEQATTEVISEAIDTWDDSVIECRTNGHSWRAFTVTRRSGSRSILRIEQQCRVCANRRHQQISASTGEVVVRWQASYQKTYLLKGRGRIGTDGKNLLRLASIRSMTITEVDDDDR